MPATPDTLTPLVSAEFPDMVNTDSAGNPIATPYPSLDHTKYRDADRWNKLKAAVFAMQEALIGIKAWLLAAIPIAWGTWTPIATIVSNLDSVTPSGNSVYIRVGSIAVVGMYVPLDATAASAFEFRTTLPVPSNFAGSSQAVGGAFGSAITFGRVVSDFTNDALSISGTSSSTAASVAMIVAIYTVV